MKREKRLKIEKEKKEKILKEGKETFVRINDNTVLGYKDAKKKPEEKILKNGGPAIALSGPRSGEQTNLFGDKDQIYNTIQSEISIIVAGIGACHDSIGKQEDKIHILQVRKDNLEKAARSVAKLRDEELKKKKGEKLKR